MNVTVHLAQTQAPICTKKERNRLGRFDPQDPHGGSRELTPISCFLISPWCGDKYINKYNLKSKNTT